MALNQEREGWDVLEDEDGIYDLLLEDIDVETLMEDVDCGAGVAEEDPANETQVNVSTREKPGTIEVVEDCDCLCHK